MGDREIMTAAQAVTLVVRDLNILTTIENELTRDPHLASNNTKRGYRYDLTAFEAWRQHRPVTEVLVEEYAAHLQAEGRSPKTINRVLAGRTKGDRRTIATSGVNQRCTGRRWPG